MIVRSGHDRRASAAYLRLLRLPEVMSRCAMSRSGIYQAMKESDFPKPIKHYGRSSAWLENEVDDWIRSRMYANRML